MIRTSPNWFGPVIIGIINDHGGKVTLRSDEFGLNGMKPEALLSSNLYRSSTQQTPRAKHFPRVKLPLEIIDHVSIEGSTGDRLEVWCQQY